MIRSTRRAPSRLRRFVVGAVLVALVGTSLTTPRSPPTPSGPGESWFASSAGSNGSWPGRYPIGRRSQTVQRDRAAARDRTTDARHARAGRQARESSPHPRPNPRLSRLPRPSRNRSTRHRPEPRTRSSPHKTTSDWCAPAGVQTVACHRSGRLTPPIRPRSMSPGGSTSGRRMRQPQRRLGPGRDGPRARFRMAPPATR